MDQLGNMDWKDDQLKNRPGIKLLQLETVQLVPICKRFLSEMSTGVSQRTVGSLLLLAWNLRSVSGCSNVFPANDPTGTLRDVLYDSLPDAVWYKGTGIKPIIPILLPDDELVPSACFTAASMLCLCSMTPEDYTKAYAQHIPDLYSKFYTTVFPLTPFFTPDSQCLTGVSELMANISIFWNTLTAFLYTYQELKSDKAMCHVLFEEHLEYTGMDAVGLFHRVCQALPAEVKTLASALFYRSTQIGINGILDIVQKYDIDEKDNPAYTRRTWKYARVFDCTYFLSVQTNNCRELVCTLAALCSNLGIAVNQNIMDIAQIKYLSQDVRDKCQTWANRVYQSAEGNCALISHPHPQPLPVSHQSSEKSSHQIQQALDGTKEGDKISSVE